MGDTQRTITIKFTAKVADLVKGAAEVDAAITKATSGGSSGGSSKLDQLGKSIRNLGEQASKLAGPAKWVGLITETLSTANQAVPALLSMSGVIGLLPGLFATAEIARKVFSLGMDGLKKDLKGVSQQLQNEVRPVFEKAFKPASAYVKQLIPDIKGVATAEAGVVTQTLKMLASKDGLTQVHGIFSSTSTVVTNLGAAFTPLLHALLTFTNVSASAFARLTSAAGDWATKLDSKVSKAAADGRLYNWIEKGISKLEEFVDKGVSGFKQIYEALKPFTTIHVTLFQTFGPVLLRLLSGLGQFLAAHPSLANWIVGVALAMQVLGPAIKGVSGAIQLLSSGWIGLIIVAIIALVAGFIYLWNTSAGFRNFWINLWHGILAAVQAVVSWFTGSVVPFFKGIWDKIMGPVKAFGELWKAFWHSDFGDVIKAQMEYIWHVIQAVWNLIIGIFKAVFEVIRGIVIGAWDVIKGIFTGALKILQGIFEVFTGLFTGNWSKAWTGIKDIFRGVWDIIEGYIHAIGAVFSGFASAIGTACGAIGRFVGSMVDAVTGFFGRLWDVAVRIAGQIGGVFSGIGRAIASAFVSSVNWVVDRINSLIHGINDVTGIVGIPHIPDIPHLAKGGTARGGQPYLVGENGPEMFWPGQTGRVTDSAQTAGILGGGNGDIVVQIGNETIARITQDQIQRSNRALKRKVGAGAR